MPRSPYPPELTEVEKVELASALGYHFHQCPTPTESDYGLAVQYEIVCSVVERMIRRRAGLI